MFETDFGVRLMGTAQADHFSNQSWLTTRHIPAHQGADIIATFDEWSTNVVDYGNSPSAVFIDLTASVQHGGFAEGDVLTDIGYINGSNFNDIIRGSDPVPTTHDGVLNNPGNNWLQGMGGDDILEGRGGADIIDGGSGSDTASYESSPTAVNVSVNDPGTGAFVASGGDAAGDTLISIENLTGSAFDDYLIGASNNNVFVGGLGSDTIDGGGGIDTVDYSTEGLDHVGVNLHTGGAAEFKSIPADHVVFLASTDHLYNIENVIGTNGDDQIIGSNSADNVLDGGLGDDLLDGLDGNDTASFKSWDSASLFKGEKISISLGTGSQDGSADRFEPASFGNALQLAEHDTLRNIENITGSNRSETITGNEKDNILEGRGGNDTIDGGFGNDILDGGGGFNTVTFASHDLALLVPDEQDNIDLGRDGADGSADVLGRPGGSGSFQLLESDTLRNFHNVIGSNHPEGIGGNEQANTINGRGGDDIINGFEGNDTLIGGDGNDRLIGSLGADILTGGKDSDTFIFTSIADSPNATGQFDVITDFAHGIDTIDFSRFDANLAASGFQHFTITDAEVPHAGAFHISYDTQRDITTVNACTTGTGANFHLELIGHVGLTASDFIL
jgi:Ca2+-binding RTX toxin-like protein